MILVCWHVAFPEVPVESNTTQEAAGSFQIVFKMCFLENHAWQQRAVITHEEATCVQCRCTQF